MTGILPSAPPRATDNGHDGSSTDWLNTVDANFAAFVRLAGNFAARAQATPDMTMLVGPGAVVNAGTLTEAGAMTYGTVTSGSATISNVGLTDGMAVGQPIIAFAYVGGTITQLFPQSTYITAITPGTVGNGSITVSANATASSPVGQNAAVLACQGVGGTFNGNTHTSTTIDNLANGVTANVFQGMAVTGSGVQAGTTVSSVAANSVTLSLATTTTLTGTPITFSVPAPATNPRIDLLSMSQAAGALSWTKGTENASPAIPSVPAGNLAIATLHLLTSTTALTHTSVIADRRANGIASGSITNAMLAVAGNPTIKSNISGANAQPADNLLTAIIDAALGSTQGMVLYRSATVWTALAAGTSGQVLETQGAGANPQWAGISTVLDVLGSAAQGDILYRDAGVWKFLAPGTAGQYLQTNGAGANPSWVSPSGIPQQGITFRVSGGVITTDHAFGGASVTYNSAGNYTVTLGSTPLILGGFTWGVASNTGGRLLHINNSAGPLAASTSYPLQITSTGNTFGTATDPNGEVTVLFY